MSSTTHHKGEKADPVVSQPSLDPEQDNVASKQPEMARSQSFAPPVQSSSSELPRSASMGNKKNTSMYPQVHQQQEDTPSSLYPKIYEGGEDDDEEEEEAPLDPREECLVTVPNAIVHLVDENQSPHLATGHFSIIRIAQKGNGIVVLVRVGENLHWPLMKDEPTVKLDPTHYFFTIAVPSELDSESEQNMETLNYGVTFPDAKKHENEMKQLDEILTQYSFFSSPTLVQGDEALAQKTKDLSLDKDTSVTSREIANLDNKQQQHGGKVVSSDVLSSDGKQVVATEENQAEFWTTMAPNVEDYGSSAARAIATGSGHVIRGIFWVRDSTVTRLESGTIYLKSKMNPADNPRPISPTTLKNLKRVRKMSRATENVAKGVLKGIVTTAGFFSGSVIKSRAGKKIFKLMPGEVALVSLDAFGKLFDAVEKATTDVLQSTSLMTQNVVAHKFGEEAGKVTEETLATAGHVVATAWTVSKLRKAFNPKDGVRPGLTKTGLVKGLAKNAIKGK